MAISTTNGMSLLDLSADASIPNHVQTLGNQVDLFYGRKVANAAALPATGAFEGQKIYLQDVDTDAQWNGTVWLYDTAWVVPTLGNSWVSFDAGVSFPIPAYRRIGGIVYLKGLMKSGTLAPAFTLPAGFRTLKQEYWTGPSNGSAAILAVDSSGAVGPVAYATGGSNTYVSLAHSFVAEV